MWDCFLTGSRRRETGERILKVLNSVEYLSFFLKNKKIDVCGDFFVQNLSDDAARLRGLHRGNIEFELKTQSWIEDKLWTPVLRAIAGEFIGLEIMSKDEILMFQAGGEPLRVSLLGDSGKVREWSPARASDGSYACFTGWESPVIEPKSCCLFRISGSICGETYNRLMGESEGNKVQIMGGEPLEKVIIGDIRKEGDRAIEYEKKYLEFLQEYNDSPNFYHVFFEFGDGRRMKLKEISDDMKEMRLNKQFGDRCISWCCSDMDFNIFASANGPLLVVAAEEGIEKENW